MVVFSDKKDFQEAFKKKLKTQFGKTVDTATEYDAYRTLGALVQDHVSENWLKTRQEYQAKKAKQVYYSPWNS